MSWVSSDFGQIRRLTTELAAIEHDNNFPSTWGNRVSRSRFSRMFLHVSDRYDTGTCR